MPSSPNLVMVVIDSLRPDHLSTFGYAKETDKNLRRIASQGVFFRNHFSVANGTAPAATTILSGLLPSTHGVIHQFPYTKPAEYDKAERIEFWLPSYLKAKGYRTMAFDWMGEWFVKGFDYYKESEQEVGEMFPPSKLTVDLAISKIRGLRAPFFAFLHLWDTHFPFPNTPFEGSGRDDSRAILGSLREETLRTFVKNRLESIKLYTVDDVVAKYDETIRIVDQEVGRLYEFLEAEGLLDGTAVIVLGDHGDVIDSHGIHFANCGMFDEAIRAPLIMNFPGFGGREVGHMVQVSDIVPTIIDFLGDSVNLDGKSLLPSIRDGKKVRDEVFLVDAFANDVKAIRTADRKLILANDSFCNMCKSNHHARIEEYDLKSDPSEERNVFQGRSELLGRVNGLGFRRS